MDATYFTKAESTPRRLPGSLLSVIIPCYGSEHYLPTAIDSIINQSLSGIEIIVVDDASKGNFASIKDKYVDNAQVRFIRNPENMGPFIARLIGLKLAQGDYIAFCDSDDMVSFDFYRKLVATAQQEDADIAIGDTAVYYADVTLNDRENAEREAQYFNLDPLLTSDIVLDKNQTFKYFISHCGLIYTPHVVWNKIYKKSLLLSCVNEYLEFINKYGKINACDDVAFSSLLWTKSQKAVNAHNVFYFYRKRAGSETSVKRTYDRFYDELRQLHGVFNFFEEVVQKYNGTKSNISNFNSWRKLYSRYWYSTLSNYPFKNELLPSFLKAFGINKPELLKSTDNYYLSLQTPLGAPFAGYEKIRRQIASDAIEVVSFDIFDTLILRPLLQPDDLFHLLNYKVNRILGSEFLVDFHELRTDAEVACRQKVRLLGRREEITLDDIYEYMVTQHHIDREKAEQLKCCELEAEMALSRTRKLGRDLYDLAMQRGKKVIFVSDMYLPKSFISKLLQKANYEVRNNIYVSCEIGVTKASGGLFRHVLRDIGVAPSRMLHIGDNLSSDVEVPKNLGIISVHLPKVSDSLLGKASGRHTGELLNSLQEKTPARYNSATAISSFAGLRCMLGLAAIKLFDENIVAFNPNSLINAQPKNLGYFLLGMHLYALASWIIDNANPDGVIHFTGRDGYLAMKAVNIIDPSRKTDYFYLSRKAIISLLLSLNVDGTVLSTFVKWDKIGPSTIWKLTSKISRFSSEAEYIMFVNNEGFPYDKKFASLSNFLYFIKILREKGVDTARQEELRRKTTSTFGSKFAEGDTLFEIGFSGRTEEFIAQVCGVHLISLYAYVNSDKCGLRSQLAHFENSTFYDYTPQMLNAFRELIYSECGPSCIAFDCTEDGIEPVFEDVDSDAASDYNIKLIQKYALEFVRDFKDTFANYAESIHFRKGDASAPFEYFIHYAKENDRKIFANTMFEDDLFSGRSFNLANLWQTRQKDLKSLVVTQPAAGSDRTAEIAALKRERDTLICQVAEAERKREDAERKAEKGAEAMSALQQELDRRWVKAAAMAFELQQNKHQGAAWLYQMNHERLLSEQKLPSPPDFDEEGYLKRYPDVKAAIDQGAVPSAFAHYLLFGAKEGRVR